MHLRRRLRGLLVALGLAVLIGCDAPVSPVAGAGAAVFDTSVLHEITITVAESDLAQLEAGNDGRVPGTFSFDGQVFLNAGIRTKGGINSVSPLDEKPAFSVKLNAFFGRQRLDGLDKLLLNNGLQDAAFLNEHLGYELYRRAGLVAPRTAHAVVTFNGEPRGIYVIREAIDRQFLEANFGPGSFRGNLYEGSCPYDDPCTDFMRMPERMELKRERRDQRSRSDLNALVGLPRRTWPYEVERHVDLDSFITGYAIDALTCHWDSYAFNKNNYYMFHRPSDGRFVFIPHGMDSLFRVDGLRGDGRKSDLIDPFDEPYGKMARRVFANPQLRLRYERELQRVLDEAWDLDALTARIAEVRRILQSTDRTDPRTRADLRSFERRAGKVVRFLTQRKAQLTAASG